MALNPSQLLREAIDRYLLLDDIRLIHVRPRNQVEKLAHTIVSLGVGSTNDGSTDPAMLKYLVDRLLGRSAVASDLATATPQDLERHIDENLKGYAAAALAKKPIIPKPDPKPAPPPIPIKRIGPPPRTVKT